MCCTEKKKSSQTRTIQVKTTTKTTWQWQSQGNPRTEHPKDTTYISHTHHTHAHTHTCTHTTQQANWIYRKRFARYFISDVKYSSHPSTSHSHPPPPHSAYFWCDKCLLIMRLIDCSDCDPESDSQIKVEKEWKQLLSLQNNQPVQSQHQPGN